MAESYKFKLRHHQVPGGGGTLITFANGHVVDAQEGLEDILDAAQVSPDEMGRPYRGGVVVV